MATLDPRLLELFETLVESGADWLVFELMEGINAGIVVEETADDLASARILASQERESPRPVERVALNLESWPLKGNDQIVWAARYVDGRLKDLLAMMKASADRLSMLVDRRGDIGTKERRSSVTLALRGDDEVIAVRPEGLADAQSAVIELYVGLDSWVRKVTDGRQTL
ncbi:hypothetical protein [uncultured Gemmobacter sp.]|uniref:hypothetical protein n=1 Tax=uncultured Gemmobacter sp. TaxID=1095917 RepID=UPI000B2467CB|nr:hypothetical protein [uncultured Gemmobacter sp.]